MSKRFIFHFLSIAIFILAVSACGGRKVDDSFIFNANLKGCIAEDTVLIKDITSYIDTSYTVRQSGGSFTFKNSLDTFRIFDVYYNEGTGRFTVFGDSATKVSAVYDAETGLVNVTGGSRENELLSDFRNELYGRLASVDPSDSTANVLFAETADSVLFPRIEVMHRMASDFIRKHKSRYASTIVFRDYLWNSPRPDYLLMDSLLQEMSGVLHDLPHIHAAKEQIKKKSLTVPGRYVYSISMNCIGGKRIQVYEQRDNYLFIEFWASWSEGSLKFRDELKAVYKKYHNIHKNGGPKKKKKVLFVGVSLDTDTLSCKISTLSKDVQWPQVCDGQAWTSDFITKYAVTYLPDNILLAPNNRVIAKGLTVNELDSILAREFETEK